MAYDLAGTGEKTLLLIHGHPFDRSMWRQQLVVAAHAGWRVVAPDLRGYGETTVTAGTVGLGTFAEDLATLLDHLDVGPVLLAGLSMGGQIAMEFAHRYPERVRGLILAATFPRAESEHGRVERRRLADRLEREGMHPYAEMLLPGMLSARSMSSDRPALAHRVLAMMKAAPAAGAAAALRGRADRPPYDDVLAGLEVPALVIVGDEDSYTTRDDAERMATLLRRSELVWMEGVGHMPNLERSDEFNAALVRFLGGIQW